MIISSTVAILITQIVGFLLFVAINALVAIIAYKLGTYDYKVSIDEGWYNYLIGYNTYQFSITKRLLVLLTFVLLLLSHFYATLMSSGYSYNWSLISLGPNHQFANWSLSASNLIPVAYQNVNFTSIPWLTKNIDNLNKITCYAIEGCGMGSGTDNFTVDNGAPIASRYLPISSWQHNEDGVGYNYNGFLLTPIDLLASNGSSAVQSNSACYEGNPMINYTYGGSIRNEGLAVNHECFVNDYTGLTTIMFNDETGITLFSIGASSASLPGIVGRFGDMMVGVSQAFDILTLNNNVTVGVLTTAKVSRGLSPYGGFNSSNIRLAISNIQDSDIENLWNSTGLYDAVVYGKNITEESWYLTDEGITGYFVISGFSPSTNVSSYQVLTYNVSMSELNLSSSWSSDTLNVFSTNIPDFVLMNDYSYLSESTGINLTSDCGLTCLQMSSTSISDIMLLNSSLQNIIRSMIEGSDLLVTSYSYIDGFAVPPSWIAINVVLIAFTIFLVVLMIVITPFHYKSTLRQVIINSVPDDEDSPKLVRTATELSLMKIDNLDYVGVAIDGKPIRARRNINESLLTDTK
jgi:hypothetical protein